MDRIIEHFGAFNLLPKDACALLSSDEYRVVQGNECFLEWTAGEKDRSIFDLIPGMPEERIRGGVAKRGRFSVQASIENEKRGTLDLNVNFRLLEGEDFQYVFVHASDRSREKEKDAILARATRLLEQRNRELEKLNRELTEAHNKLIMSGKLTALGRVAGSMIMEMQYPLQLIMVNASLLDEHMRDPESTDMLQSIVQSSSQVSKIVESLRGFVHDEAREPMVVRPVRVLIDDTIHLCREQIQKKKIDLKIGHVDTELYISCHPTEICQVLLNLLTNAWEAVEDEDDSWIRVEAHREDGQVRIAVIDSGGGLPSGLAEKLMEPFFTTKDGAGSGTGLGLTIARKIVGAHGGKIEIDGDCDDTCFNVRLPLVAPPAADDGSHAGSTK